MFRQTLPLICTKCLKPPGGQVRFSPAPHRLNGCWDYCDACRQRMRRLNRRARAHARNQPARTA
jgi:hypothetical protein